MQDTMTKRIWKWLLDLPDEYEYKHHDYYHDHDHPIHAAEHNVKARNGRSSSTPDESNRTMKMKKRFAAGYARFEGVEIVDLTGDDGDIEMTVDEDERGRKEARTRLRSARQADAVVVASGRKRAGRKRETRLTVAKATLTRTMGRDTRQRRALQSVC